MCAILKIYHILCTHMSIHAQTNPHDLSDEKPSLQQCPLFSLHRWHIFFEMQLC